MSTVTTAKVDTINGLTDLTLTTGNTSGPRVVVKANGTDGVVIGHNSTVNTVIVNSTGFSVTSNSSFTANVNSTANVSANVLIGNSAVVSSNTLTLGTSSIASPGYSRLPNGLLLQWGNVSVLSSNSVTFPVSFGSVYSVTAVSSAGAANQYVGVSSLSITGATFQKANGTVLATVYWTAIGS